MPRPTLTDEEFRELLHEPDPFKLAILGTAAIEADVDHAIAQLVPGPVPSELRDARFQVRLAVAAAIQIVPPDALALIRALARVRNGYAHGERDALNPNRIHDLLDKLLAVTREEGMLRQALQALKAAQPTPPIAVLRPALIIARAEVQLNARVHLQRREAEQQIIQAHRAAQASQFMEQLLEKLREANEEPPTEPS